LKPVRIAIVACSLLVAIAAVSAQDAPAAAGLTDNPVFQNNCARCHGKEAKGHIIGPPSLTSGKVPQLAPDEIRTVITNGKGHMPKFGDKLSTSDIDLLIQQIKMPPPAK
jgi:mono/diheme cytochrome c family protein